MQNISKYKAVIILLGLLVFVLQPHAQLQPYKSFVYEPSLNDDNIKLGVFAVSESNKLCAGMYSNDETIQSIIIVWDMQTSHKLLTVTISDFFPSVPVYSLAFSPDDKMLAAGMSGAVKLFDLSTGVEIRTIETSTRFRDWFSNEPVNAVAFSPDGRMLVTNEAAMGKIQFWDPSSGKEIFNAIEPERYYHRLTFSKNRPWLFAASEFDVVIISSVTGERIRSYSGAAATFSVDGLHLFTLNSTSGDAGASLFVKKWNIEQDHVASISNKFILGSNPLRIVQNGRFLLIDNNGAVRLKNVETGDEDLIFIADNIQNFDRVSVSADNRYFITWKNDQIFIFDISNLTSGISLPDY